MINTPFADQVEADLKALTDAARTLWGILYKAWTEAQR